MLPDWFKEMAWNGESKFYTTRYSVEGVNANKRKIEKCWYRVRICDSGVDQLDGKFRGWNNNIGHDDDA